MECMVFPDPAVVLAESDIEHPMQAVLDTPVTSGSVSKGFSGRHPLAADAEGTLHRNGPIDIPLPLDHADAGKLGPAFLNFLSFLSSQDRSVTHSACRVSRRQ